MSVPSHPVFAFSVVGVPFALYSVHRTGYDFGQLVDVRLLHTAHAWPVVLLTGVLVCTSALHTRGSRHFSLLVSLLATAAFLGGQCLTEFPLDYKLWIYIVAPTFVWCSLFSLPIAILLPMV